MSHTGRAAAPLLVSGFEPFGGLDGNVSGEVARALHGTRVADHPVVGVELPCRFDDAAAALLRALRRHRPALVLALGLAPSRRGFWPEHVAINWVDARIADNAGAQPLDAPVVPRGPAARFSTLPAKAIAAALRADGFDAELSLSAGSYVCNHVFYRLLHAGARRPGLRAGFMHLGADLGGEHAARGVRRALEIALRTAGVPTPVAPAGRID